MLLHGPTTAVLRVAKRSDTNKHEDSTIAQTVVYSGANCYEVRSALLDLHRPNGSFPTVRETADLPHFSYSDRSPNT